MFVNDNTTRQKTVKRIGWKFRETAIVLALFFLVFSLIISCGDDSNNPSGPTGPDDPVDPTSSDFVWPTASPAEHGFDSDLLDTLTNRLYWGHYGRISSLLIARSGYLVYEEYFRGCDTQTMVNIYSCTKSVASTLVGIAIAEGSIGGVEDRLFDYLDGYDLFPHGDLDSLNRESITLEHLLTMTAGFAWDESSVPYGHQLNSYNLMVASDDWIQFTLNKRVVSTPGTAFEYNTGLSGLMAVILENSTGQSVEEYAEEKLFRRIGIKNSSWRVSPQGIPMTGNALHLRPRDMAKYGWLYSQNGVWDGDTVVPSSWVHASCQPHIALGAGRAYGYQWWMVSMTGEDGSSFYMPYALGYGGQHIFVPPMYDMVIVVTAMDDLDVSSEHIDDIMGLIGQAFTP